MTSPSAELLRSAPVRPCCDRWRVSVQSALSSKRLHSLRSQPRRVSVQVQCARRRYTSTLTT